MGLKLYFAPGACSFVPHTMLEMAGADYEPVLVKLHKGEQGTPEFLALNPRGQVPVLVDDGQVIDQVIAIVLHLDQRFPGAGLLPVGGMARTKAIETLMWMNNTVHVTFAHVFMPHKFIDDAEIQKAIKTFNAGKYRELLTALDAKAAQARPWLAGDRPGALDAYALTLMRWGGFAGVDPTSLPALWDLAQRFAALPAVARVVERERLKLNVAQTA